MRILFAFATVLMLTACGQASAPAASPETDAAESAAFEAVVTDAFVMVPLEGRDVTMGGAVIEVTGQKAKLVAAEAAFAEAIELHTVSMDDGQMRMRQVDGYDLTPGTPLALQRGSDHLMVFGVTQLESGSQYPVRLTFQLEDGTTSEAEILATAKSLGE
ncbi:MAG: copper chaperone PCu(A)C [Pseudomonadota bacterium]